MVVVERPLSQFAAISSDEFLLPFPSCACAAKPLFSALEGGCDVFCFLAHLGLKQNRENQTFFSQACSELLAEKAFTWLYH